MKGRIHKVMNKNVSPVYKEQPDESHGIKLQMCEGKMWRRELAEKHIFCDEASLLPVRQLDLASFHRAFMGLSELALLWSCDSPWGSSGHVTAPWKVGQRVGGPSNNISYEFLI